MTAWRASAWLLALAWCSWGTALQSWSGAWAPDLGLLLVCWLSLEQRRRVLLPALLLATTRAPFVLDAPAALLAAALLAVLAGAAVGRVADRDLPIGRCLAALTTALVFTGWRWFAADLRAEPMPDPALVQVLAGLLTTALAAPLVFALVPVLPGMRVLGRRRLG